MTNVPCLLITFNRLEFTKQALKALMESDCGDIYIIDNASTDESQFWLQAWSDYIKRFEGKNVTLIFNSKNLGVAGAMNQFLSYTQGAEFVCKVDNDTRTPKVWVQPLVEKMKALDIDLIQCKHHIIPATHRGGWDGFIKQFRRDKIDKSIHYSHFIGGSGIVFRRDKIDRISETEHALMGWRQFQREHPELKKAFCSDVEIELLDKVYPKEYEEYYKQTGRI